MSESWVGRTSAVWGGDGHGRQRWNGRRWVRVIYRSMMGTEMRHLAGHGRVGSVIEDARLAGLIPGREFVWMVMGVHGERPGESETERI